MLTQSTLDNYYRSSRRKPPCNAFPVISHQIDIDRNEITTSTSLSTLSRTATSTTIKITPDSIDPTNIIITTATTTANKNANNNNYINNSSIENNNNKIKNDNRNSNRNDNDSKDKNINKTYVSAMNSVVVNNHSESTNVDSRNTVQNISVSSKDSDTATNNSSTDISSTKTDLECGASTSIRDCSGKTKENLKELRDKSSKKIKQHERQISTGSSESQEASSSQLNSIENDAEEYDFWKNLWHFSEECVVLDLDKDDFGETVVDKIQEIKKKVYQDCVRVRFKGKLYSTLVARYAERNFPQVKQSCCKMVMLYTSRFRANIKRLSSSEWARLRKELLALDNWLSTNADIYDKDYRDVIMALDSCKHGTSQSVHQVNEEHADEVISTNPIAALDSSASTKSSQLIVVTEKVDHSLTNNIGVVENVQEIPDNANLVAESVPAEETFRENAPEIGRVTRLCTPEVQYGGRRMCEATYIFEKCTRSLEDVSTLRNVDLLEIKPRPNSSPQFKSLVCLTKIDNEAVVPKTTDADPLKRDCALMVSSEKLVCARPSIPTDKLNQDLHPGVTVERGKVDYWEGNQLQSTDLIESISMEPRNVSIEDSSPLKLETVERFEELFDTKVKPFLPPSWQGQSPSESDPSFVFIQKEITEIARMKKKFKTDCQIEIGFFHQMFHHHLLCTGTDEGFTKRNEIEKKIYKRVLSLYYLVMGLLAQVGDQQNNVSHENLNAERLVALGEISNEVFRFLIQLLKKWDELPFCSIRYIRTTNQALDTLLQEIERKFGEVVESIDGVMSSPVNKGSETNGSSIQRKICLEKIKINENTKRGFPSKNEVNCVQHENAETNVSFVNVIKSSVPVTGSSEKRSETVIELGVKNAKEVNLVSNDTAQKKKKKKKKGWAYK